MASFTVKYQSIDTRTKGTSTSSIAVNASSVSEARQKFKSNHTDTASRKYKVISVVKN